MGRRRRWFGDYHPDTLTSAINLADELAELGEHEQAGRWPAWTADRDRSEP